MALSRRPINLSKYLRGKRVPEVNIGATQYKEEPEVAFGHYMTYVL